MAELPRSIPEPPAHPALRMSQVRQRAQGALAIVGQGLLLAVTASSALAVLFIFFFILQNALPFFRLRGVSEFFTSTAWYPTGDPPAFGALAILVGSGLVTLASTLVAVPLGLSAAICLSDMLPARLRQVTKPIVEVLAAIPSVAYGFFALVVLAPLLQERGSLVLVVLWWAVAIAPLAVLVFAASSAAARLAPPEHHARMQVIALFVLGGLGLGAVTLLGWRLSALEIVSGTNALNVSLILGLMALPTIISVSEDSLQAVGRELREGSYALGATRAETLMRVVIPAARSGLTAAVILGVMRAVGETMVVWMASGNAARIPGPWYDLLDPVRTLTATIAGEMGEADHTTGSARYHVLFAMALVLLTIAFACNALSERIIARVRLR